jgi:hypothetical protein
MSNLRDGLRIVLLGQGDTFVLRPGFAVLRGRRRVLPGR